MPKEKLLVELRAGGLRPSHVDSVLQKLASTQRHLDFLDFLSYIPLFIYIHLSVVSNPLDTSQTR